MALGGDNKELPEGRGQEGVELLLGEKLKQGRLLAIEGAPEGSNELHGDDGVGVGGGGWAKGYR
jgi:hypothetical protein